MSQIIRTSRGSVATAAALLLASLAFAGCGGSSSTSSTSARTASTSSTTTKAPAGEQQFAALRACLQKNRIPLPKNITAQNSSIAAILASLPKGVTRAQFEAAVKTCGGLGSLASAGIGTVPGTSTPAYKQAVTKFVSCMRANGVNLPNASGTGATVNTKGIDTHSAKFKAALAKCAALLRSVSAPAGG
jgi:hypothetical protein